MRMFTDDDLAEAYEDGWEAYQEARSEGLSKDCAAAVANKVAARSLGVSPAAAAALLHSANKEDRL